MRINMKKIVYILTLLFIVAGAADTEAKTRKSSGKRKTNTSVGKNSTTQGSAISYAIFNVIPFEGKVPTIETYGLNKSEGIKRIEQKGYHDEYIGFTDYTLEFDKEGRLVLWESQPDDWYYPERLIFTYNDNGEVASIDYYSLEGAQDSMYMPLVECIYKYKWEDGKVKEITETIKVDEGINYQGKPSHLDLSYDENGNLTSAVCRENPKVFYKIDNRNKIIKRGYYACDYRKMQMYEGTPSSKDEFFSIVNKKKIPLKWEYRIEPVDYETVVNRFNSIADWEDLSSYPGYTYDSRGNWSKRMYSDEDGTTTYERTITYY